MADQQILSPKGSRPAAEYLVSADQVTITGDGAYDRPLVAHLTAGPPTVERLVAAQGVAAASPTVDFTFVTSAGPSTLITLADGVMDGFKKTILLNTGADSTWHVRPTHFANGTQVDFLGGGGALTFSWNASAGSWDLVSTVNGTVA